MRIQHQQIRPNFYEVQTPSRVFYFSYQTCIAFADDGPLVISENAWSQTTGKHLNWLDGGTKEAKKKRLKREDFLKALKAIKD